MRPRVRTIIVAHPSNDLYGSDRMALRTIAAFVRAEIDVHVAVPIEGRFSKAAQAAGAKIVLTKTLTLRKDLLSPRGFAVAIVHFFLGLWGALRVVHRVNPDVVYVNTVTIPTWQVAAFICRTSCVVHVREAEPVASLLHYALTAPLLMAKRVIANSNATKSWISARIAILNRRTTVLYNGIQGPAEVVKPPVSFDPPRIALVGRISPRKGHDVAIKAFARTRAEGQRAKLIVIGSCFPGYEPYEDELKLLCRTLGVSDDVEFVGYRDNVWQEYQAATFAIVPSRVEPFGNVAVEAMLCRRVVIASDIQGLSEIIINGHSGYLVPKDDVAALAKAMTCVLRSDDDQERIAQNALDRAQFMFSPEAYNRSIVELVSE